ncbi:hypothetical protein BRARA_A00662 [Brassica rapa]|uniref:Uncharacterized protein n=1 Tax=Brassica campestris TaxID=3711 RepID=A0A398AJ40_BRACM|nr:hypothetical protein BRARA_A00662 [Brassica rapa]
MLGESGETKVGDLEVAFFVKQEILRLEISVVNPPAVAEIDGGDQLLEVHARHVLAQPSFGDFGEQLPASHELHSEVDLGFARHHLVELDDVRMLHHPHH